MKKIMFAVLFVSGFSGAAIAQSSATLYGVVDEGFMVSTNANGSRQFALASGTDSGSRWGLKGVEDLGGGASALFTLENGFNSNTGALGQNGTLFGRQAFVGLSSKTLGTVILGRQYPTGYDFVGPFSAGGDWAGTGAGYGAHPGDLDNLDGTYRTNNTVKYKSPSFSGASFGAMYSFGGVAGNMTRNEVYSLGAGYANGPVAFGAGYTFVKNPNYSFYGDKANDSTTASNMSGPVFSGYATAGSQQIAALGASYKFGAATLSAVYSNTKFSNLGSTAVAGLTTSAFGGEAVFNVYEVSGKYSVTPALQVAGAYAYTRGASMLGESGAKYNQVDLGADYSLSRRTDLYVLGFYQMASGHDSTGGNAVASIAFATPSSSNRQLVVVTGIRHKF